MPEDAELSNGQLRGPAGIPTINGPANGNGARRATRGQMRPSMEARWRKLDISMLQVPLPSNLLTCNLSTCFASKFHQSDTSTRLQLMHCDHLLFIGIIKTSTRYQIMGCTLTLKKKCWSSLTSFCSDSIDLCSELPLGI